MSRSISTILTMRDKMSSPLVNVSGKVKKVTRDMKQAQNQVKRWSNSAVKSMDRITKTTGKVALATGALATGFVLKTGWSGLKDLDAGARKVKSIAKDSLQLKNIQKDLLSQSNKTGIGVKELAETQYSAISSGVSAAESMLASVQASKLAVAGFGDANSSLKLVTATMNVYGQTGQDAMSAISNKLMVTQNLGVTTVAELSNSLGGLTPVANSANLGIDELMSGMASLTKNGLKTEEAVAAYKGVLVSVIKPSKEAAKVAKKLGIDFSVGAIKSKGFAGFLEDVREKTGGSTEVMGQLFGNVRALSGSLILTGKGLGDFKTSMDAMANSAGAVDEAYKIATGSIGFKVDKMKNIFKNTATSIMNTQSGMLGEYIDKLDTWVNENGDIIKAWVSNVGKSIGKIITAIKKIFDVIKKNKEAIITIASLVLGFYAAFKVIKKLKTIFMALNTIWLIFNGTLVVSPLGWVILAIGVLTAAIVWAYRNIDLIKQKWSEFGDKFPRIHKLVTGIGKLFKTVFIEHINKMAKRIQVFWEILKGVFGGILEYITTQFDNILKFIENVLSGNFKGAAQNLVDMFLQPFKSIYSTIVEIINKVKTVLGSKDLITVSIAHQEPSEQKNGRGMQEYALGGIANKASIFGEAGPEMAIPLKKNNARSQGLLMQANKIINGSSEGSSVFASNPTSKSGEAPVTLNFHGPIYGLDDFNTRVTKAIVEAVTRSKKMVVKPV